MADHHGRKGNPQGIRAVQGLTGSIGEQQGLDAKFHGGTEGSCVDANISADAGGDRIRRDDLLQAVIDEISRKGQDESHVEAVGAESQDAAVTEEQGLDEQGHADGQTGRVRPEEDGNERTADGVSRRTAGQGDIEHHGQEGKGRSNAEEGQLFTGHRFLDLADGQQPDRDHDGAEDTARRRAQVIFRYMHNETSFP